MNLEELRKRAQDLVDERRTLSSAAVSEARGLTEDEAKRISEIDEARKAIDVAVEDAKEAESRAAQQAEARRASGLDRVPAVDAKVVSEPRTYESYSKRGYYWDLAQVALHTNEADDATHRLARHNYELAVEVANNTKEGRSIERIVRAERRNGSADDTVRELRERGKAGLESRALTTGTSSGGAFAPPVYLLDLYAPFRTAGRAFINSLNNQDLPASGMTISIPAISNAAGVATQSTQNTAITETDPGAGYITANVNTLAGEITVSQQLLDRTGPWDGSYDAVMFDQLTRAYNTQADTFALTAALAGAGSVSYTGSFALGTFYSKVNGAQATIRSTPGVFRNPTAVFVTPARWSYIATQTDGQGRPLVVPNAQQPMNAMSAGGDNPGVEGFSGYNMTGLDVYQDASIPTIGTSPTTDQAIVLDPSSVLVFEGDLVPRVLPQTLGNQLSVILQVYAYIAVLPLYPLAVQSVNGSAMSAPSF